MPANRNSSLLRAKPSDYPVWDMSPTKRFILLHSLRNVQVAPSFVWKSEVALNRTRIALPNIHDILNSSGKELLQSNSKEPAILLLVDAVMERAASRSAASGFDVKHVIKTLRDERQQYPPSMLFWIIGAPATLIFILILIILVTRLRKFSCNCLRVVRGSHPTPCSSPDAMELKCKPLELQTLTRINNKEQPVATGREGGNTTSHESPTRFVRHGVIEEDVQTDLIIQGHTSFVNRPNTPANTPEEPVKICQ
jgi:hypothetical protein